MKKSIIFFWIIVGALFFCSASLFLYQHVAGADPHQDVDSKAYLANAQLFVQNNSFAWPDAARYPYYTLGYALILALLFKLFGLIYTWVIIIQVLLALIIALLLFDIGRKIANNTVGVIAYLLATVNLGFLIFAQFLLAELWLTFFLVLFFHRFVTYLGTQRLIILVQAGFILGISVLIKPAAFYFWPLLLPLFLVGKNKSFKKFFGITALWCAAFYLPIAGYMLHNKVTFGRWYVSALDHENTFYWFFPNVLAHKNGTDQNFEREQLRTLSELDVHKKFILELCHAPRLFIGVWLKNVSKTWLGLFTTNLKVLVEPSVHGGDVSYFKTKGSVAQRVHAYITSGVTQSWVVVVGYLEIFWSLLRLLLCFIGMLWLIKNHRWNLLWLFTTYLAYFSLITGHDGCARFRMLFEFVLIVLASLGIWALTTKAQGRLASSSEKS
ncbi:glycosyltransferase family 39 protein [Candidatus Dependentiae bacterium]|nr:glycosyltransferase family 39 protein [Candidatus Dependentiae bacterium]